MWKPPEYPGPCFDLHFDRFDGLIFEAEKPFENVCATGASPVATEFRVEWVCKVIPNGVEEVCVRLGPQCGPNAEKQHSAIKRSMR